MLCYEDLDTESASCKCTIRLSDADFHCNPDVSGLIIGTFESLSVHGTSCGDENSISSSVYAGDLKTFPGFDFQKFGLSNYFEPGTPEHASIPLDRFPFVTISNAGSLGNLESYLLYNSLEWKKYFNVRDRRIRCPQFNIKKESEEDHVHAASSKSLSGTEAYHSSRFSAKTDPLCYDFSLCEIRLHFHDSSSIVGTLSLPCFMCSPLVYEDCMEALCSLEGLILTSSWWTRNFHEFLWGPSKPILSPILNVRVKKNKQRSSSSHFDVGIGVQHLYCILPPEYLALLIGYVSLSDWSSYSNENHRGGKHENVDAENEGSIVYKFKILDSILMLPVESSETQFLKVDIQQLYSSFISFVKEFNHFSLRFYERVGLFNLISGGFLLSNCCFRVVFCCVS